MRTAHKISYVYVCVGKKYACKRCLRLKNVCGAVSVFSNAYVRKKILTLKLCVGTGRSGQHTPRSANVIKTLKNTLLRTMGNGRSKLSKLERERLLDTGYSHLKALSAKLFRTDKFDKHHVDSNVAKQMAGILQTLGFRWKRGDKLDQVLAGFAWAEAKTGRGNAPESDKPPDYYGNTEEHNDHRLSLDHLVSYFHSTCGTDSTGRARTIYTVLLSMDRLEVTFAAGVDRFVLDSEKESLVMIWMAGHALHKGQTLCAFLPDITMPSSGGIKITWARSKHARF